VSLRIAAVGDVHAGADSRGRLAPAFAEVGQCADVLLLAGDLTRMGTADEARVLADELAAVDVPIAAVLGNHDHHSDQPEAVTAVLADAGVRMLDGDATVLEAGGCRVGIAGVKGFGGGFVGTSATDFGEPEMKAFIRHTARSAAALEDALRSLADVADSRIALLHYSPVPETLAGEPPEIHAFLGSYLLAEAIDRAGADLVLHGHAHRGRELGMTAGGVKVRNVAQPVIQAAFRVYSIELHARTITG
jgi:Icc-related predicted phosphoesterase